MNAILKDQDQSVENQLVVITDKLSSVDFYTKTDDVVEELKKHVDIVNSINFEVTENGKRNLKEYLADERKSHKLVDSFRKDGYASLTAAAKIKHDAIFEQIKAWTDALNAKPAQFEEFEANQLSEIREKLISFLSKARGESNLLRDEFISDSSLFIEKLKKLSAVTPNGALTGATKELLKGFVDAELAKQFTHDSRILTIENRCLRADINPPLGKVHLGGDFWENDAIFEAKLDQLVSAEITRREEMAERIKIALKKQEQDKIDAAIAKERAEAAKKQADEKAALDAKLKAEEEAKNPTPEKLREQASNIADRAQHADRNSDMHREMKEAEALIAKAKELENAQEAVKMLDADGKKLVKVTAIFENNEIREHLHFKLNDAVKSSKTTIEFEFSVRKDIPVQKVVDGVIGLFPYRINLLSIIGE